MAVMAISFSVGLDLEGQLDVADGNGHADLHVLLVGRRDGSGDAVLDRAAGLATGAGVADAHPASALRGEACGLCLLEQRATVVGHLDAAVGEGDRSTGCLRRNLEHRRDETLEAGVRVVRPDGVDQRGWPAHEDRIRSRRVDEVFGSEVARHIAGVRFARVTVEHPNAGQRVELEAIARLLSGAGVVDEGDVTVRSLADQRSHHRQHRGDAAAAGDEEDVAGTLRGEGEVAADHVESEDHPGPGVAEEVPRHHALVVHADGQLDEPVPLGVGR